MADASRVLRRALGWTWRLSFLAIVAGSAALWRAAPAGATPCSQATISWDGGAATTAWTTAANWTGDRLPSTDDHVCIPSGTPGASVTHSGTTTIKSLEAQKSFVLTGTLTLTSTSVTSSMHDGTLGGNFNGPGELRITGTVNWTGGELKGAGTTRVVSGAQLNITAQGCCSNRPIGANHTLVNDGTLAIAGGEGLNMGEAFRIENNGTLTWAADSEIVDTSASTAVKALIVNTGTIVKTTGGVNGLYVPVWNKSGGVIKSDYGTLQLYYGSGGNDSAGTFAGGVTLYGTHRLSGATFTGTGNLIGNAIELPAGTTTTIAAGSTTLSANVNGPGKLAVPATLNWKGGELRSETVLEIPSGGRLNLTGGTCCSAWTMGNNASVLNNGTISAVSGSYGFNLGANFRIQNNGTFELTLDGGHLADNSASTAVKPLITNAGTIVKTTGGTTGIYVPVWNQAPGLMKSDSGELQLHSGSGGNPASGTFGGGVVLYGTHPLAGATFTGTRNAMSGTHALSAGTTTTVASGSTTLAGNVTGPGKLLVQGTLDWKGGELKSSATAEVAPGARLNVIGSNCCSAWNMGSNSTVVNNGTLYVGGVYGVNLGENLRIQNNETMELASSDGHIADSSSSTAIKPLITNYGTIVKTVGGNKGMYLPVLNQAQGTIKSNAGELQLHNGSGGTPHAGTFAGGVVLYGAHPLANASFTGAGNKLSGTHVLSRGTTSTVAAGATAVLQGYVEGPGKLLVRGTLDWTGGEMRNFGSTYVAEQGRLNIPTTSCCSNHELGSNYTLVNDGTLAVGAGEGANLGADFHIYNNGTFTWDAGYYGELAGSSTGLISNSGTFVKTGYDRGVYIPMENDGTMRIDTGMTIHTRFRSYSRTKNILKEGEYVLKAPLKIINFETFSRNAARITLDGPAAVLADNAGVNALRGLTRNAGGGRITLKNGATLSTLAAVRNAGKITVEAGSTLTTPGYTQVRGATVVDGSTATLNVGTSPGMSITGGSLRGTGVVQGNVTNSGGSVMPGGAAPGQLSVQGSFTQTSLGSLDLDVGGPGSYDSLAVSGVAALNGRLALVSSTSYAPVLGDSFTWLTYASQTGAFASFSGTGLPGGLTYAIQLQPQSTTAVVQ